MEYTLIKIDGYWIVMSNEAPKYGDLIFNKHAVNLPKYSAIEPCSLNTEKNWENNMSYNGGKTFLRDNYFKLVASQNPAHNLPEIIFSDEVAKELGIVDVEKSADKYAERLVLDSEQKGQRWWGYQDGYNQCLEDNKEKKYTEEDIISALFHGYKLCFYNMSDEGSEITPQNIENYIQSLNKQEYKVELEMEWYKDFQKGGFGGAGSIDLQRPKITNNCVTIKKIIK